MISVERLTKRFGNFTAVNQLSFEVPKGSIVGFLGPNGAGKSTTMRCMTGFYPLTEGEITIDGHAITRNAKAVQRIVGYLPEAAPLYREMSPQSFLMFRAKLREMPVAMRQTRIDAVADVCHLNDVMRKPIQMLSKGYRQRVALADAMLHDPDVLILDEPTVGLDPNQIVEARNLIRHLREHHTILFSSHILSEVQALCDHIVIINRGELVANDSPAALLAGMRHVVPVVVECEGDVGKAKQILGGLSGVEKVDIDTLPDGWQTLTIKTSADVRESILSSLSGANLRVRDCHQGQVTLEDLFMSKTSIEGAARG